jgi:hypothetical protein
MHIPDARVRQPFADVTVNDMVASTSFAAQVFRYQPVNDRNISRREKAPKQVLCNNADCVSEVLSEGPVGIKFPKKLGNP